MEEKIRQELYEKLLYEYDHFIEHIKQLTKIEIIDSSYEKVMKQEFVYMFYPENIKYDISDIKALNKIKNPLEELYQGWIKYDGGIHNALEDSVKDTVKILKKEQKNKSMER